jgi:hypothetical protein
LGTRTFELHATGRPTLEAAESWIGARVYEAYGARVGKVDAVLSSNGEPRWLVVRGGRFASRYLLIPCDEAIASGGQVWVPYMREVLLKAAELAESGALTPKLDRALRDLYLSRPAVRDAA